MTPKRKFASDVLELDHYLSDGDKTPSLKLIFDNLRCYPILAFFGAGILLLGKGPGNIEAVAFWFLVPFLVLAFLATVVQTSMMLTGVVARLLLAWISDEPRAFPLWAKSAWFVSAIAPIGVLILGLSLITTAAVVRAFAPHL